MTTMTCRQLGGACDIGFHANTFEKIGTRATSMEEKWSKRRRGVSRDHECYAGADRTY